VLIIQVITQQRMSGILVAITVCCILVVLEVVVKVIDKRKGKS
jgi:hypothetical protein